MSEMRAFKPITINSVIELTFSSDFASRQEEYDAEIEKIGTMLSSLVTSPDSQLIAVAVVKPPNTRSSSRHPKPILPLRTGVRKPLFRNPEKRQRYAATPFQGKQVSQMGRPTSRETKLRKARFLLLVAEGLDVVEARRAAGVNPDHALRYVTDPHFGAAVSLLRESQAA